jgi:hypothetical protein
MRLRNGPDDRPFCNVPRNIDGRSLRHTPCDVDGYHHAATTAILYAGSADRGTAQ